MEQKLIEIQPDPRVIIFYDREQREIGRLTFEDGRLHFEGQADESAEVFLSALTKIYARGWWREQP